MADEIRLFYGDQKRRLFLIVSAFLLTTDFCIAILFKTLFTNPWLAVFAFLLPAIENLLAAVFLNRIRWPEAFLNLAFYQSAVTLAVAFGMLNTPHLTLIVICCVNIVWTGLFHLGLDLATLFELPLTFGVMACGYSFWRGESVAWAYAVPIFLVIGMDVLRFLSADGFGHRRF